MLDKNYEKGGEKAFASQRSERIRQGETFGLLQREKKANKKKKYKELKRLKKGEAW